MSYFRQRQKGQALLLVTLALFAMCGVLGLAVDLGWGYFSKKTAQASTDAGALAGAYQALKTVGPIGTYTCGGTVTCAADPGSTCTLSGNLANACEYAVQAGLASSNVKVSAGTGTPPTGQSINASYWVTVRTAQIVPQLFSAVLGNSTGLSSARSTAAIVPILVNGNFIALNRANDPGGNSDITLKGHGDITAPQGIYVANNSNNGISTNGATQLNGPIVALSGAPNPNAGGTNTFQTEPDGVQFMDPFAGMGQPPLPTTALPTYGVPNGNISSGVFQLNVNVLGAQVNGALPSGNYVPVTCSGICKPQSTVIQDTKDSINLNQDVTLDGGAFGSFFFYNGLSVSSTVTMGPGQYVVVGGKGSGTALSDGGILQDANGGTDAGQMIIVTGSSSAISGTFGNVSNNADGNLYPGLATQINSNQILYGMATTSTNPLGFAQSTLFKSGTGSEPDPSGLNPSACTTCSTALDAFAGVVFWQDQANSTIQYTSNGNINTTCGGINSPCSTSYSTSPEIDFHAQGDIGFNGIFYQPRGAGIHSNGHGNSADMTGNLKVITGYFSTNGGGGLILSAPPIPLKIFRVALIE